MAKASKNYKKYLKFLPFALFVPLILYAIYLGSVSAIYGELDFYNDVARDFLLLQEMDTKKLVLIGARSSTTGVYNGSLWTYINYPAYLLGNGNPVFQLWFWILLGAISTVIGFFITRKLFGTVAGLFFALLFALRFAPHVNGMIHANASFLIIPLFFFGIAQYVRTQKIWYLILHLVSLACLIQFNIGTGTSFLLLSIPLVLFLIIKTKAWKHLLALLALPVCLINYILFDLKNGMRMTLALTDTGKSTTFFVYWPEWVSDRLNHLYQMELLEHIPNLWSQYVMFGIFLAIVTCSILEIKKNKKMRSIYLLFFYFYLGYFGLSYLNKGIMLFHYVYLLAPLTSLWLVSFTTGKYRYLFIPIAAVVVVYNFLPAYNFAQGIKNGSFNTNANSWKSLSTAADIVLERQKGKEFGYYVFAPDSFAYQPRYAMMYHFRNNGGKEYTKLPTTYIVAQGAPSNDPYMDHKWWVKTPVGITKHPVFSRTLDNKYVVIEYELTPEEQKIPHDKSIELGIHFR